MPTTGDKRDIVVGRDLAPSPHPTDPAECLSCCSHMAWDVCVLITCSNNMSINYYGFAYHQTCLKLNLSLYLEKGKFLV